MSRPFLRPGDADEEGRVDVTFLSRTQCHITARLNHLESRAEQVIMSLPVGAESITR